VQPIELNLLQTIKPSNLSLTTNAVCAEVVFKAGSFYILSEKAKETQAKFSISSLPPLETEITYLWEESYRI
jgi:hypothetical protein